jgi:hypothetical protein
VEAVVNDFEVRLVFLADVAVNFYFGFKDFATFGAHVLSCSGFGGAPSPRNRLFILLIQTFMSKLRKKGFEA